MSSETSYHLRTDVLENMWPLSSGFLRVIGLHSCVTVESLFISLPIEGYYVGSQNIVFWDVSHENIPEDSVLRPYTDCGCLRTVLRGAFRPKRDEVTGR
jgi:hypothetical protein